MELQPHRLVVVGVKAHFHVDLLAVRGLTVDVEADLPIPHVLGRRFVRAVVKK